MITKQEKTLLDEFAMAALTGMLANPHFRQNHTTAWVVQECYILAHDMMKERQEHMPETKERTVKELKELMQDRIPFPGIL